MFERRRHVHVVVFLEAAGRTRRQRGERHERLEEEEEEEEGDLVPRGAKQRDTTPPPWPRRRFQQTRSFSTNLCNICPSIKTGLFAVGTDSGFRIFNADPFKETFRRDSDGVGDRIVEMLFRCNILALVRRRGTEIFAEQSDDLGRSSGAMYRRAELSGSCKVKLRRTRLWSF